MYDEDLALEVIGKGVGVDVNKTDGHGFSALHYACQVTEKHAHI